MQGPSLFGLLSKMNIRGSFNTSSYRKREVNIFQYHSIISKISPDKKISFNFQSCTADFSVSSVLDRTYYSVRKTFSSPTFVDNHGRNLKYILWHLSKTNRLKHKDFTYSVFCVNRDKRQSSEKDLFLNTGTPRPIVIPYDENTPSNLCSICLICPQPQSIHFLDC